MRANYAGFHKRAGVLALSASFFLLSAALGRAQIVSDGNPDQTINLSVSNADKVEAGRATSIGKKMILPPKTGYGVRERQKELATDAGASAAPVIDISGDDEGTVPTPGYYTTDLSYLGGPVITDMESHPIYLNTLPKTVGYPGTLLRDLGKSNMVHVIDQYVGATADNRYRAGLGAALIFIPPFSGPLHDSDMLTIAHAAAKYFGKAGYHAEFHIFTGPGQDICFSNTPPLMCYSPDNPATFFFCAYHGSAVFSDIGEVIYSVQPYVDVPGCNVGTPSPNGPVIDSTMSALSHEFFESITDPDGDAWLDITGNGLYGSEIGDICEKVPFVYPFVKLNGRKYELQAEYSNKYHGCAYVP
jgi:hypothetical protein